MESIFIFIIFIVISSLFNKNKHAKKTHRRPGNFEDKHIETRETQTFEKPKTLRELPRGGLGGLIEELKTDLDDVFKEKYPEQKEREDYRGYIEEEEGSYHVNHEYEGYGSSEKHQEIKYKLDEADTGKKARTSKKAPKVETLYEDEIRDEVANFNITFDKETLLQGIIMSEILGKPKALKR